MTKERSQAAEPALSPLSPADTEARLAAIVESTDDAVVSKDLTGRIWTWNPGAERIFGWKAHEVIGKSINIIIPPERSHEEPEILRRLQRGERVDHFETVRLAKDGRRIELSVTISPIRNAQGQIVAASKIARDITAQKRSLAEMHAAKEAAEQANHAKDRFLSALSHELRTPLTAVLAQVGVLEALPSLPAEVRAGLAVMRRNLAAEAGLVNDLLDVARIANGKLALHLEAIDLHAAVAAVAETLQTEARHKQVAIELDLRAPRHVIWADEGRLQQILLNLVSNAVKFSHPGGRISITSADAAADAGGRISLEIADQGVGIDPEDMGRLFGAFEQGSGGQQQGGLGLGLAIAQSLVELHQGSITVESPGRDQGAVFTLEFPTTAQPLAPGAAPRPAHPETVAAGYRILFVEDHADTRAAIGLLLKRLGCEVRMAANVDEALTLGRAAKFDLLLCDLGLPDGTGLEVIEALRGRVGHAIALTGFGESADIRQSRQAGFDQHITKPIDPDELLRTVTALSRP